MSQEFYFWVHTPEKGMSTKAHRHVNSWDFPGVQWLKLPAPKKKTKKKQKNSQLPVQGTQVQSPQDVAKKKKRIQKRLNICVYIYNSL